MTIDKFKDIWDEMDDEMRCRWLHKHRNNEGGLPPFSIEVDNDDVSLVFKDSEDDPTKLSFDEFGYYLIPIIFKSIGFDANVV